MIGETDALEAARRFTVSRNHAPWSEASVHVRPGTVEGRRVWVVSALDELSPGQEEWMRGDHEPVRYFVDVTDGKLVGFEVRSSRTMFT